MKNKSMTYLVSDVCKMLNITEGSLRYYEKHGYISCRRNEETGQKYYNFRDYNKIISLRNYRELGFNLEDAGNLLRMETLTGVQNSIEIQKQNIQDQIHELNKTIQLLELKKIQIEKINIHLNNHSIINRPAYTFLCCHKNEKCLHKQELKNVTNIWFELYPNSKAATQYYYNENTKLAYPQIGFIVSQEQFISHKDLEPYIIKIPAKKCIYTIAEVTKSHMGINSFYELLEPTMKYIKDHNFIIDGPILTEKITTIYSDGQLDYYELFVYIK